RRWRLVRARRDAVPESVRRFSARARRRRLRAARPWLAFLGTVLVLASAGGIVYATPLLGVAHIRVEGATLVTPDEVRAAVADAPTRIRLDLRGGRAIIWGDATENEDKARVATSLLGRPVTVIDVSAPDVVTFH